MRRLLVITACLAVLLFAGTNSVLAGGPHHRRPPVRQNFGYGPAPYRGGWQSNYRYGRGPYCPPRRRVAAYPVYPTPYPAYPQYGFGLASPNFSFWVAR